jgi:RecA-family ATPase
MSAADEFYAQAKAAEETKPGPWESRVTVVPQDWYTTPAPPRQWLLRDARNDGEGVFPLGKAGLLVAEGGAGKTMLVVQLALAIATGTTWLGTFDTPNPGKVLIILGEEDAEEVHRRIHRAAHQASITPPEGAIVTLPLAGIECPMIEAGGDGPFLTWLREYVTKTGPYRLVIADPVSRFCGPDAERDNAAGTRFCQALESLIIPSGGASILGSHHVNKGSRGSGATVDASSSRGSSAIVDGVRWVSTVAVENIPDAETVLTFAVAKTNYSKKPPPLQLRYSDGGVLVGLDEGDREKTDKAREDADPRARRERKREQAKASHDAKIDEAVLACVEGTPGIDAGTLRTQAKARAGCGSDAADTSVDRLVLAGRIRREKDGKPMRHYLVASPPAPTPAIPNGVNGAGMAGDYDPYSLDNV